ncbi:MAG: hypothetical protein JO047_03080, partial [Alphaproteobacteria bacterium]|nr:hypothetical protein [Alphaproteobacteria bacterium]
ACGPNRPRPAELLVDTLPPGASCITSHDGAPAATVEPTPGIVLLTRTPSDVAVACRRRGYVDAGAVLHARPYDPGWFDPTPPYAYDSAVTLPMTPVPAAAAVPGVGPLVP